MADSVTDGGSGPEQPADPMVFKISPMAHFAVLFLALGLLALVMTLPWTAPVLVIPMVLSLLVVRLRTTADGKTVTVRNLLDSKTVDWSDIAGLRFEKTRWARADLTSGEQMRLPAVTFAMLPLLAEVSGGRVPNPYG